MIDEKKLIEEIGEYTISVYGCDINDIIAFQTNNESKSAYIVQGICEAIYFIEEQPKVGEWIPCSERLPEPIRPVLVTLKNWMNDKCFVRVGRFHTDHWKTDEGIVENSVVLAWQPLPQPFQKGE